MPPVKTSPLPESISNRLFALTGHTDDLEESLEQWENEQELVKDLYANYDQFRIHNAQLILLAKTARKIIEAMQAEAGLFLSEKSRNSIVALSDQFTRLEKIIPQLGEK